MKFRKLPIWALALSILAGSGCVSDDYNYAKEGAYATVSFAVEADNNLDAGEETRADGESSNAKISIADALGASAGFDVSKIATDDFNIVIKSGKKILKECLLKDYKPEELPLEAGSYSVTVSYDPAKIGFYTLGTDGKPTATSGLPAFASEEVEFNITAQDIENETPKAVEVPVTLKNSILRIKCTEMFTKYFSEYSAVVTQSTADDASSVAYEQAKIALHSEAATADDTATAAEAAGAFFEPIKTYITYTFTPNPNQAQGPNAAVKTGVVGGADGVRLNSKTCHTVIFDVTTIGGVNTLTITFNDVVTEVPIGDIEINN